MISALSKLSGLSRDELKRECFQLLRFLIVGGLSFGLTAGLYALFTRILWPQLDRSWMNLLANCICAIFNFLAHQRWTYKAGKIAHAHISRYLFVLVTGLGLNGILFWLGHSVLHVDDRIVFVGVAVLVPLYTYSMHRQFTFREAKKVAEEVPPVIN